MSEAINDGCYDCGGGQSKVLTSVTAIRPVKSGRNAGEMQVGSYALCDSCLALELKGKS